MEQTKHTPGPWQFSPTNIGGGIFGDEYGIITPNPMAGINVRILENGEGEANARLIAAAPETAAERDRLRAVNAVLLAACEAALPEIEDELRQRQESGLGEYVEVFGAVVAQVRAALATAQSEAVKCD